MGKSLKEALTNAFDESRGSNVTAKQPSMRAVDEEHKQLVPPSATTVQCADFKVLVDGPIKVNRHLVTTKNSLKPITVMGLREQAVTTATNNQREVNIGLDFGTSSVKVVVGDEEIEKAFAVPFFEGTGIDAFLLPSRVWLTEKGYSLNEGGKAFRDLKVRLMGNSCTQDYIYATTAFLALVIRHVKTWFLDEHYEIYRDTYILWKLTLGLPAKDYEQNKLLKVYKKIGQASWWLSINCNDVISRNKVIKICTYLYKKPIDNFEVLEELNDVDFDVVPELSAQVFGFLQSSRFDPKARNYYMLIDVGAGTVDSTVFYVKRERGKKYSFGFFANCVESNGVANLHKYRLDWIHSNASKDGILMDLKKYVGDMEVSADSTTGIPENLNQYFENVTFTFHTQRQSPDSMFYRERLIHQVLSKTFKKAIQFLPRDHVVGMPLFLCGGGSRMKYYKKIENSLNSEHSASWVKFRPQQFAVPSALQAPGVTKDDFDRLSVAFGLSYVKVGRSIPITPYTPVVTKTTTSPKKCGGCGAIYGRGRCTCG